MRARCSRSEYHSNRIVASIPSIRSPREKGTPSVPNLNVVSPSARGNANLPSVVWGTCNSPINSVQLTEIIDLSLAVPAPLANPANYFTAMNPPTPNGANHYWTLILNGGM